MELEGSVRAIAEGFSKRGDELIDISEARAALSRALDAAKGEALKNTADEALSELARLLSENEKSNLALLSCVAAESDNSPRYASAAAGKDDLLSLPICAVVLSAVASVCAFLQADYAVGAIAALAAFQGLYMTLERKKKRRLRESTLLPLAAPKIGIPAKLLGTYIINASARIAQSVSDINDIKSNLSGMAGAGASSASAELYQILYEMKHMNEPSYIGEALDLSHKALLKADLDGIEYRAGNETCFDILEGGETATLRPAIVTRRDGKLVKRGEALIRKSGR
ncbi:MAG: hypothetical protein PHI27_12225 [Eubacteriales bacterium]|nr:hypothetical protein [Eubacteriales bacterium]MDD3882991.1 hypothetical protein [Eubacteriales bacterium]MDD4513461.1 hypothetical protein [Eubacteriales bacterium]